MTAADAVAVTPAAACAARVDDRGTQSRDESRGAPGVYPRDIHRATSPLVTSASATCASVTFAIERLRARSPIVHGERPPEEMVLRARHPVIG